MLIFLKVGRNDASRAECQDHAYSGKPQLLLLASCIALVLLCRTYMKREHLGELEQIVLLAILRVGPDAYGVPIRQEIEARTGRALTVGALYRTLDRL